jgi:hypothetical protein
MQILHRRAIDESICLCHVCIMLLVLVEDETNDISTTLGYC